MSRARVIVTRPAEEAAKLIPALDAIGCEAVLAPMLEIVFRPTPRIDHDGVQAILITSANGARALASALDPHAGRGTPVLAVGEASAAAARDLGFKDVESANGDVDALIRLVGSRCTPKGGRLLHPAGSVVAGELKERLESAGYVVERHVLYEARPIASLGGATVAALGDARTVAALFFSPRTAETFVTLVRQAGLEPPCGRVAAICLSDAVARVAGILAWGRIAVASRPEQAALIDTLAGTLAGSRRSAG